jgi:hypothetical protein
MHEVLQQHKAIKNRSCKKCNWQAINCPDFAIIPKINSGKAAVRANYLLTAVAAAAPYFPALSINSAIRAVHPV